MTPGRYAGVLLNRLHHNVASVIGGVPTTFGVGDSLRVEVLRDDMDGLVEFRFSSSTCRSSRRCRFAACAITARR
jgi:hypothetical protein